MTDTFYWASQVKERKHVFKLNQNSNCYQIQTSFNYFKLKNIYRLVFSSSQNISICRSIDPTFSYSGLIVSLSTNVISRFSDHFLILAVFEAAGAVAKFGSILKSGNKMQLSLSTERFTDLGMLNLPMVVRF
jgi:hypothetical protein